MTASATCPNCGHDGFFGPAEVRFTDTGEVYHYVNCKRCGAMLVVGRDVTLEPEP